MFIRFLYSNNFHFSFYTFLHFSCFVSWFDFSIQLNNLHKQRLNRALLLFFTQADQRDGSTNLPFFHSSNFMTPCFKSSTAILCNPRCRTNLWRLLWVYLWVAANKIHNNAGRVCVTFIMSQLWFEGWQRSRYLNLPSRPPVTLTFIISSHLWFDTFLSITFIHQTP